MTKHFGDSDIPFHVEEELLRLRTRVATLEQTTGDKTAETWKGRSPGLGVASSKTSPTCALAC
jgi:hypothetical protein